MCELAPRPGGHRAGLCTGRLVLAEPWAGHCVSPSLRPGVRQCHHPCCRRGDGGSRPQSTHRAERVAADHPLGKSRCVPASWPPAAVDGRSPHACTAPHLSLARAHRTSPLPARNRWWAQATGRGEAVAEGKGRRRTASWNTRPPARHVAHPPTRRPWPVLGLRGEGGRSVHPGLPPGQRTPLPVPHSLVPAPQDLRLACSPPGGRCWTSGLRCGRIPDGGAFSAPTLLPG